jgi:hypothetical protein
MTCNKLQIKSCFLEPNKSDLELANLKGRVSRVRSTVFQVKNSVCPPANCGVSCKQTITSYNEKGKIMGTCCINDDGDTVMISKYVYDRRQRCKEIDKYSKNELAGREVNGQVDSLQELDINGKVATITRHFRNENQDVILSSVNYPERDEEVKFSFQYEYDGQHNWTQQKQLFKGDIIQIIVRNISYYD